MVGSGRSVSRVDARDPTAEEARERYPGNRAHRTARVPSVPERMYGRPVQENEDPALQPRTTNLVREDELRDLGRSWSPWTMLLSTLSGALIGSTTVRLVLYGLPDRHHDTVRFVLVVVSSAFLLAFPFWVITLHRSERRRTRDIVARIRGAQRTRRPPPPA